MNTYVTGTDGHIRALAAQQAVLGDRAGRGSGCVRHLGIGVAAEGICAVTLLACSCSADLGSSSILFFRVRELPVA